jgi:hypothetical protein
LAHVIAIRGEVEMMGRALIRQASIPAVVLLCVLLSAVLVVGACGSTATGLKTYADADYSFSFEYPASWQLQKGGSADITAGGSSSGSVGVYDPKGAVAQKTYIDVAQVSVYKLNQTVDDSMMPQIKTEVESVLASIEGQAPDMKTMDPLAETTVGGMSGFKVTYSLAKNGAPVTSTMYFLFSGALEYQVTVQAADENWSADRAIFDALLASFKP